MSQRLKSLYLPATASLVMTVLLLQNPQLAALGFQNGLSLCIHTVLPALFPFFVLCELLMACPFQGKVLQFFSRLLGLRHEIAGLAVFFSWIGGYAVCAHLTGTLRKNRMIDERESNLLLMLGCCSSPGFVVGCIGGLLLGNLRIGVLLYCAQIAANLLSTAFCLPLVPAMSKASPCRPGTLLPSGGLSGAINSAVSSSLNVCGCVLFFRIICTIAQPLLPQNLWSEPILCAALEISSGCAEFAAMGGLPALYGCCICMSLLGLSVWVQISMLLEKSASLRLLAVNRLLHLGCFLPMVCVLSRFLPGIESTYTTLKNHVVTAQRLSLDAVVVAFIFVCATLYKVRQNFYNK